MYIFYHDHSIGVHRLIPPTAAATDNARVLDKSKSAINRKPTDDTGRTTIFLLNERCKMGSMKAVIKGRF